MRFSRMRSAGAAGLGLAALLLAACGGQGASTGNGGTSGPEKTHLIVGALPVIDDAPLFLAIKRGYFKQQGLTVTPQIINQSTLALPDMLHGTVDIISGGNYVSYFEGQAQGTFSIRVLVAAAACQSGSFAVLALPGSGITSPASLAGKTVAVNLTNNIQTLVTNAVLKADKVAGAPKYVAIPFPDMATALKAHRVDAISVVEPFLTGAEQAAGAKVVMSECTGPTANFPLSGYFATAAWTKQYPRTARAFQHAMAKAQALAARDPAAVKQILPTYTKITATAAQHISLNSFPAAAEPAQLQRVADLMQAGGLVKNRLSVTPLIFR